MKKSEFHFSYHREVGKSHVPAEDVAALGEHPPTFVALLERCNTDLHEDPSCVTKKVRSSRSTENENFRVLASQYCSIRSPIVSWATRCRPSLSAAAQACKPAAAANKARNGAEP
jgi:hypothetical protein